MPVFHAARSGGKRMSYTVSHLEIRARKGGDGEILY
jgi:hypothetical protein